MFMFFVQYTSTFTYICQKCIGNVTDVALQTCWCTEGARPHVCSISTEMIHSYTKQSIDVLSMMNA